MGFSPRFLVQRVSRCLNSRDKWQRLLSSISDCRGAILLLLLQHSKKSASPPCSSLLGINNYNQCHVFSRDFCSQGPAAAAAAAIDYSALLQEDEFHKLADATIQDLLEKIEEYGDSSVDIDGFDIDYGNQVLTVKFGSLGTYVLKKQTPNRQIWMSSPVSGPSRFDWDRTAEAWIYRRTKAKLVETLENEIKQPCGEPIKLS